ncbi:MAG: ABC transporter permease [Acidimicrobiales bacterium]
MIWTIAKREILTRGRSKGFLILTGLLFVGVIAIALVQLFLNSSNEPREVTIGLTDAAAPYAEALAAGTPDLAPTVEIVEADTQLVDDGTIDVLFDGTALTWEGLPDRTLDAYVRDTVQQAAFTERADGLGLAPDQLGELFAPLDIGEVRLDGGDDQFGVRLAAAVVSGFATFMLLQMWGSFLMMGVIEEKSSRVVEILLSHVRPATLLSGKVLGLGVLALGQMLIFVLGLVVGLLLVEDITIPAGVWSTVPLSVVTFLLGFGFYATAYAAVGSMVSRQEDATSAQLPVMFPLLTGYFIAAASFANPDNLAVTIGSFVPFTSPVLLPFRNATVDMPAWQIALSLGLLAASIVVTIRAAGWIYRYSLLRTGSRVTWAEAWRNRHDPTL